MADSNIYDGTPPFCFVCVVLSVALLLLEGNRVRFTLPQQHHKKIQSTFIGFINFKRFYFVSRLFFLVARRFFNDSPNIALHNTHTHTHNVERIAAKVKGTLYR